MQDAINQCADTIITTGAIQSNHCRATAAASAKLGLDCHLVLVGEVGNNEGNYFLDKLLGAKIHVIKESSERETYVEELIQNLNDNGHKAYYMPVGASTSVGALGYQACFDEIIDQEKAWGLNSMQYFRQLVQVEHMQVFGMAITKISQTKKFLV